MAQGLTQEKLTAFFRELPPAARARLASAMNGEGAAAIPFRDVILEPLIAAQRALGEIPPAQEPTHLLLAPLDPFIVPDGDRTRTSGLFTQQGRDRLATWLAAGAGDLLNDLAAVLRGATARGAQDTAVEAAQDKLALQLTELLAKADTPKSRSRLLGQMGGDHAADLEDFAAVLHNRALLANFVRDLTRPGLTLEEVLKTAKARLDSMAVKHPEALPFAFSLARQKLPNVQTFVRLAAVGADSTDGSRISETPYVRVLDLVLAEAERQQTGARRLSSANDRGQFLQTVTNFGSAIRALATEIDLVPDGPHTRGLAVLRRQMAEAVRADLQDLPPRIRRLVRPRPQERAFEDYEIARLSADLDLLLISRSYAEEITLNALSGRVFSEVRELLDTGTPQLMERLRAADETARPALRERLAHVVSVSAKVFGAEYAALMSKAVDVAGQEPRTALQARSA